MKHLLFVYGSLKQGGSRHQYLNGQRYLGVGVTAPKYSIHRIASFPALIEKDEGREIWGELYEVSGSTIPMLDEIEGVQQGLYQRRPIELVQTNIVRLPLNRDVFDSIQKKTAETYIFQQDVGGAADCGQIWVP